MEEMIDASELTESVSSIGRGAADARAGRVRPLIEGLRQIAGELGTKLLRRADVSPMEPEGDERAR